jgi:exodeoxyribonuclease V gamma subunit
MLHVVASPTLEPLTRRLGDRLAAERDAQVSALPEHSGIVVPNRSVEEHLKLAFARRFGIAANLEITLLKTFLRGCIAASGVRTIEMDELHLALLGVLGDPLALAADALAPVRRYLDSGHDPAARDRRASQLAERLARLFEEYGFSRAAWTRAWRHETRIPADATEAWQSALWRLAIARFPQPAAPAPTWRWLTIHEAFDPANGVELRLPEAVHVFGFSTLAAGFHDILAWLGERTTVWVSLVCVPPVDPEVAAARDDAADWPDAGRRNLALLCARSQATAEHVGVTLADRPPSVLRALQRSFLGKPEADLPAADASFRAIAAPGIRREAESVAHAIWGLVAASSARADSEPLRFHEIAVLVPAHDAAVYQAHLAAAFREQHRIPFALSEGAAPVRSRYLEAAALLLALPGSRATRRDLLPLLRSPALAARRGAAHWREWSAWCRDLAIHHGAEHRDHDGTYIEHDRWNWDQGLRRLELGLFFDAGETAGPVAVGEHEYLPYRPPSADLDGVASFVHVVRALLDFARQIQGGPRRRPVADWITEIERAVRTFLSPLEAEERPAQRFLERTRELRARALAGTPCTYATARDLLLAATESVEAPRSAPLTGGVVVSPFVPLRPVPFRAIVVMGLGEGHFPRRSAADPLDLRGRAPEPADLPPREKDTAMFLDTLLAAREHLIVSWVGRDLVTGDRLQPSAVVRALLDRVRGFAPDRPAPVVEYPLRRHDPCYFEAVAGAADLRPQTSPAARRERLAALWHAALARSGAAAAGRLEAKSIERRLAPRTAARLRAELEIAPPAARGTAPPAQSLSLSTLRAFLEDPLEASLALLLGRADDLGDVADEVDEPLDVGMLERTIVLRSALEGWLARSPDGPPCDAAGVYADRTQRLEAAGHWPVEPFRARTAGEHHAILASWVAQACALALPAGPVRALAFGRLQDARACAAIREPLALTTSIAGAPHDFVLTGTTSPITADGECVLLAVARKEVGEAHVLRGFVEHAAWAAAGQPTPRIVRIAVLNGGKEPVVRAFRAFSPAAARAWIGTLAADLLGSAHDYHLPYAAVLERQAGVPWDKACTDAMSEAAKNAARTEQRPLCRRPERARMLAAAEADLLIARRFGELFARHVVEDAT